MSYSKLTLVWRAAIVSFFLAAGPMYAEAGDSPTFGQSKQISAWLAQIDDLKRSGMFVAAVEAVDNAMISPGVTGPIWAHLKSERAKLLKMFEYKLEIEHAKQLLDSGKAAEARELLSKLTASDIGEYNKKLISIEFDPSNGWILDIFLRAWSIIWEVLFHVVVIALSIILLLLVRFCTAKIAKSRSPRWRLAKIDDKTERSSQELVEHHFEEWRRTPASSTISGLLILEATSIPTAPKVGAPSGAKIFGDELTGSSFEVAGVKVGALASFFEAIILWFWPRTLPIIGAAYIDSKDRFCIRLTAELREQKKNTKLGRPEAGAWWSQFLSSGASVISVSAVANGRDEASGHRAATEVTYKMMYALETGSSTEASDANDFRDGLNSLRDYLAASPRIDGSSVWSDLHNAKDTFERIRKSRPNNLEAHIYEGIALDLMERHEDAAAHFDHVKRLTKNSQEEEAEKLHKRAVYNGAVAHLRNLYGLEPISEAIERLDGLIGNDPDPKSDPLIALAMATKADAYANRTIHWRSIDVGELGLGEDSNDVDKLEAIIQHHTNEVMQLTNPLRACVDAYADAVDQDISDLKWDSSEHRQIEWAINNAHADFYLYSATAMLKVDASEYPGYPEVADVRSNTKFETYVERALEALRQCEMLLPAGVETLSNIGTLYFIRGRDSDLPMARRYLDRAIALNPHYEYAHYRLALTWQAEGWREMVIQSLEECPVPPQIPQFRQMFQRYYVQPKSRYEPAAKQADGHRTEKAESPPEPDGQ